MAKKTSKKTSTKKSTKKSKKVKVREICANLEFIAVELFALKEVLRCLPEDTEIMCPPNLLKSRSASMVVVPQRLLAGKCPPPIPQSPTVTNPPRLLAGECPPPIPVKTTETAKGNATTKPATKKPATPKKAAPKQAVRKTAPRKKVARKKSSRRK